MATNIDIDPKLLDKAKRVGGMRTKKETVTKALEEFIQRREQRKILDAMGTVDFRDDWDYKADRRVNDRRRQQALQDGTAHP